MSTVSKLGERSIIRLIQRNLEEMSGMPLPFGDDASAIEIGSGKAVVANVDMLVGLTDVPKGMNPWQIGRKAVVMGVSDLASKGVQPTAVLVSLGLPEDYLSSDLEELAKGLNSGAREFDAYVIGGDVNESRDLIVDCAVLGIGFSDSLMRRRGAKPGHLVAVTGLFGYTAVGLKILSEGTESSEDRRVMVDSVLMPQPRLREGLALAGSGAASASIDSSDGLAWSLHELSELNSVGFTLDDVPIAPEVLEYAEERHLDPCELALYGGEEYELVVTLTPDLWSKAAKAVRSAGGKLFQIGHVTRDRKLVYRRDGKQLPIRRCGWEHFKTEL